MPDDLPSRSGDGRRGVLAGLIVGLVSMIGGWHPSFATDESATISAADRSLSELWRMVGNLDLVHGLYYLTMHPWVRVFGTSELSLRLPSTIALAAAGACVYWIGIRLGGRQLAVWAVVAFAILPRAFWAGVEGRSYAMTALLAAAMTLALLAALDTAAKRTWVTYAALIVVSAVWNIYLLLVVAGHLVSLVADRTVTRPQRIQWCKTATVAGVVSLPFAAAVSQQAEQVGTRDFDVLDLAQNAVINQWFLGDTPTRATGISTTSMRLGDVGSWWAPAAVAMAALSWLLIAHYVLRPSQRADLPDGDRRSPIAWFLPWLVLPTAAIGGYSLVTKPTYSAKYLTLGAPAAAALIALGLLSISSRRLRAVALAALVVAAIPVFVSQRQLYGKKSSDWVSVADHVADHAVDGDGVYFAPRYDVGGSTVGASTRAIEYAYPDEFTGLVDITLIETPESAGDLIGRSRRLADSETELEAVDTLWVIRRVDYPKARKAEDDAFLADAGFQQVTRWAGPLDVVLEFERA